MRYYAYFDCHNCGISLAVREMSRPPREGDTFDLPFPFVLPCPACGQRSRHLLKEMKFLAAERSVEIVRPIHPAQIEREEEEKRQKETN